MFLLINRSYMCLGIFSTKEKMGMVVETIIKEEYEKTGEIGGNYHFRYIEFNPDDVWFDENHPNSKAIFSLSTMHPECFNHEIETDWSTGKIIKI